jgi:molybdopterin molybdotransferase
MSLLPVDEALRLILASVERPVEAECLPLAVCAGRTLAEDLASLRDQPPFPASAMDGYAVRSVDVADLPATLRVTGTSAAGHRFHGIVGVGEAVRIFTGAPVPDGADAIVIQENTNWTGNQVIVREQSPPGRFIRPAGLDFRAGQPLLKAGDRLDAKRLALAAAMGHGQLPVRRRPRVAILATGDELVRPGESLGPDQIIASNPYAIAALVERAGGEARDLGIAADTFDALEERIAFAKAQGADLLVTLGGASVGEHDLVQSALVRQGMSLGFWRIALRPGKPLMHGRLGSMLLLGLPGNPVSSIVCGVLFLVPALRALLGDPAAGSDPTEDALLGSALPANDGRQDYLRATLATRPIPVGQSPDQYRFGIPVATPHERQDSSMLAVLERSDALVVRPPHAPPAAPGEPCRIVRLDRFC